MSSESQYTAVAMDPEKGDQTQVLIASTFNARAAKLLVAVSIALSCLTLTLCLVVIVQNYQLHAKSQRLEERVWVPSSSEREIALREVSAMLNGRVRSNRGVATATNIACGSPRFQTVCSSKKKPNSTEVPTAHIVPSGSAYCTIQLPQGLRSYSIISSGWTCGGGRNQGHVRGGMVFNQDLGVLTVPVEGIYFIYSQVHLNMSEAPENIVSGHQTLVCSGDSCRDSAYLVTKPITDVTVGAYYHGGLFHLMANSNITIVAWYSRDIRNASIAYQAHFTNTFFGAFLVNKMGL